MENVEQTPVMPAPSKGGNTKMFWYGFGGILAVIVVLALAVGIYRVYAKTSADKFTVALAKALFLPAGRVNGKIIYYSDYADDLKAINVYRANEKAIGGANGNLTDEQMSDQVIMRLVSNILLNQEAAKNNIKVEKKNVDDLKAQLLTKFGTQDKVNEEITKSYGWTLPVYEKKVMEPYVLQGKLKEKLDTDVKAREEVRQKAQEVLTEALKPGADFVALAKQYGQDGTAAQGGDLGWFGKGEMVPQFEAAAFALKKGEIAPQLVESEFGYHVIKLEDRKTEKTADKNGKTVKAEKISARQILFRFPSLEQMLGDDLKNAKISVYLKVHNPFAALKK